MNPALSAFNGDPAPKSLTAWIEPYGGGEISTWYSVRSNGTSEKVSYLLRFDGKEYSCRDPSIPERPDTVVSKRVDTRTAEIVYRKAGRVVVWLVRRVSFDNRQLIVDVRINRERGTDVERTLVFDREMSIGDSGAKDGSPN